MIVCDERNPTARRHRDALFEHLPDGHGHDDLIVVLGGDGFLLKTVAEHDLDKTYLGLNAGRLGFLLNDVTDWASVAHDLLAGSWRTATYPLLQARIQTGSGGQVTDHAINDVYLERATSQTTRLRLMVDGQVVVEQLVADGVIFSTALGSTAYTFSAGGPACHPSLHLLAVTPICPHSPRLNPLALPASARVQVDVDVPQHRPVRAVVDGRAVEDVRRVEVDYDGSRVKLGYLGTHDFTSRMVRKILHP